MLTQIEPARADFAALARYLMLGKERPPHPDRVAWIMGHNLHTADPELAAALMTATAERSRRCREPCYHLSINWREDEQPSPETMQEVATRTLAMAGLAEHQALIVGHGDKPHRHLHMMINRVHPETGRAWSNSHDYRRFDRIMRLLAEEYGFVHAPCHRFDPELTDDLLKGPNSAATWAARRGAATTRRQWSARDARTYGARLSAEFDTASRWEDLAAKVAADGYRLEAKGKGHVVGNADGYAKLSALGLQRTAKGFEKRRPPPRRPSKPEGPFVDAVDIARALVAFGLVDRTAVRSALDEANAVRLARLAKRPLIEQLLADLKEVFASGTAQSPPGRRRARAKPSKPSVERRRAPNRQR
jgi:hypothetical protein